MNTATHGVVAAAEVGGDPYFANVSLLLHCDGVDEATSFPDSGPIGHTVTAANQAQIDTAQSRFGGASASFDGTGDRLEIADHASFDFGSGDFTIEGWFRTVTTGGNDSLISKRSGTSDVASILIRRNGTDLRFSASDNGSAWNLLNDVAFGTVAADTWYHFAVVRHGNAWYGFLDGTRTVLAASLSGSVHNDTNALRVGGDSNGSQLEGWMDEVRITKGVARYTANFTPPTQPFPNN